MVEIEERDIWKCKDCDVEGMTHVQMRAHLSSEHGFPAIGDGKVMGRRRMVSSLDGDGWYQQVWEVEFRNERFEVVHLENVVNAPKPVESKIKEKRPTRERGRGT